MVLLFISGITYLYRTIPTINSKYARIICISIYYISIFVKFIFHRLHIPITICEWVYKWKVYRSTENRIAVEVFASEIVRLHIIVIWLEDKNLNCPIPFI